MTPQTQPAPTSPTRVSSFVDRQVAYDRMFEPFTGPLLDAAQLSPGQRVLDIGCGAGTTTLLAADRVTPRGLAIGVDVDADAIRRGRDRARGARRHHASFMLADAEVHRFQRSAAGAVISRFGTLHFADPEAAFENLRRATKPGGRLAMLCAQALDDNLWARLPLRVLQQIAPDAGAMALSRAAQGGPFTLAKPDRLRHVVEAGDWGHVKLAPLSARLWVGEDVEATLAFFDASDGPRLRLALGDAYRAFREALAEALSPYVAEDGVRLPGAVWLATGVNRG
jgi:SAM-dependent methyltransferase